MWLQEVVDSDSFTLSKTATSNRWGNTTLNYELNLQTIDFAIYEITNLVNCMFMLFKCVDIRILFLKHIMLIVSFLMANIYLFV